MIVASDHHRPRTPGHAYSVRDLRDLILWHAEERAAWDAERQEIYRRGLRDGARHTAAYWRGWADCETAERRRWRAVAGPIAHPDRNWQRRLRDAEAGARADAVELERAFVAKAYNTQARNRTDPQAAAVVLYPPPEPRRGRRGR
jgi:hypothetical protein